MTLEDLRLFTPGRRVLVVAKTREFESEIEKFHSQHGRWILKLRGIDSISDAESSIGAEIRIPIQDLIPPETGSFYTFQLKGCQVHTTGGEFLGTVTDILDTGGTELLRVERDDEETLIPFARAFIKTIDLDRRHIEVELPEGLRELNK